MPWNSIKDQEIKHHNKFHCILTSSSTRMSSEPLMVAGWSTSAEKHFGIQAGVETRISGGPTNAAFCNQYLQSDKSQQDRN